MRNRRNIFIGAGTAAGIAAAVGIALVVIWLIGYGHHRVAVAGNEVGCVYSSAASGGRFVRAIAPGTGARVSNSAQVVLLPTGEQVYNVTTSANRTQGAPSRVLAFTKAQTAVWIEGVLKFRFNTAGERACRWYSKYGLQASGWSRVLAQADNDTLRQVVHDGSSAWTWQQLAYGSDPAVETAPSTEPVSVGYGKHIGAMFTKYLDLNLGDRYFCGVQPALTGAGEGGCPPVYFQALSAYPRDKALADEHEKLKQLDAALTRQRQAAKLKAMNRSVAIASARAQRKVLLAQIVNTRLDAQNDVKVQKCLILARVGLDCDGHKETVIVAGGSTTKK
jgi:hypothetical protein